MFMIISILVQSSPIQVVQPMLSKVEGRVLFEIKRSIAVSVCLHKLDVCQPRDLGRADADAVHPQLVLGFECCMICLIDKSNVYSNRTILTSETSPSPSLSAASKSSRNSSSLLGESSHFLGGNSTLKLGHFPGQHSGCHSIG